jgi:gluconate 5-dehydrogenase
MDVWLKSLFSFAGQRVLVTGASRGIGRALAVGFARAGADLVLTARTTAALENPAEEIRNLGRVVSCVSCDQRSVTAINESLADIGPIDVLVNNAGVEDVRPAIDVDEALWDKIVDTNLKGAFFTARAVAAGMASRGGGAIINLASLTSFVGVSTAVPYTASKSGILGLTRALSTEWAPFRIRVNAIAPGYFRTELTDVFYDDPEWVASMTARVPLGRLGHLDDLVGTALFLGGRASGYMSGQCVVVDGGYLAAL